MKFQTTEDFQNGPPNSKLRPKTPGLHGTTKSRRKTPPPWFPGYPSILETGLASRVEFIRLPLSGSAIQTLHLPWRVRNETTKY